MLLLQGIRHALREAAMADGGDAGGAQETAAAPAPAQKASVHDRIKAFMFGDENGDAKPANEDGEIPAPAQEKTQPQEPKQAKQEPAAAKDETDPNPDTNDIDFTSVSELAERTGLPLDRILDLSVPAKDPDGKEARRSIRELLKSYQLDSVLNSKLSAHAAEVQTWKQQQAEAQAAHQQNMQRLDAGLQVAQRALHGEFNQIDWDGLQQQDPAQFAQTLLGFQQRQAMLTQIADQIGQERAIETKKQQEQAQAWLGDQQKMLEAKLPEWSDKVTRAKAIKEIVEVLGPEVGFTEAEINGLQDHRDFVVANMALQWLKLQKSKADVMNKVRAAPPLLKPGAAKSTSEGNGQAVTAAKAQLRKSGNVKDAARALRAMGIV